DENLVILVDVVAVAHRRAALKQRVAAQRTHVEVAPDDIAGGVEIPAQLVGPNARFLLQYRRKVLGPEMAQVEDIQTRWLVDLRRHVVIIPAKQEDRSQEPGARRNPRKPGGWHARSSGALFSREQGR